MASITLRYFDCRGRAQPLRFFLQHMGADFVDERVRFDDGWQQWALLKSDPKKSGPFGKLPVLEWSGELISETNPIYAFVQEQLADSPQRQRILSAQSALASDLGSLFELLNLDLVAPGTHYGAAEARVREGLEDSLRRYEALASGIDSPFDPPRFHSIAAFWLLEVWQLSEALFGDSAWALVDPHPKLRSLLDEIVSLPAVVQQSPEVPAHWSARPDEAMRWKALREPSAKER